MNVVRYEPWVLVNRLSRDLERLFNAPYESGDDSRSSVVDWVPAVAIAMMRSPESRNKSNLRNVEMWSTPAFVRVSPNITSPSRTRIPQQ